MIWPEGSTQCWSLFLSAFWLLYNMHQFNPAPSSFVPLPTVLSPTLNAPQQHQTTHSPAYLPGLQLLHQKWGQGQAEVREQWAHGNGSGENQSNLPTHTHQTRKQRQAALALSRHAYGRDGGRARQGVGDWEKPQGRMLTLGPVVGMRSTVSTVPLTSYCTHKGEA